MDDTEGSEEKNMNKEKNETIAVTNGSLDKNGNPKNDDLSVDNTDGAKNDLLEDEIIILEETDDENSTGNIRRLSLYGMAGKKTAAQGLMDIALITANANQLRYVLELNRESQTFHITVTLIILSLALQVAVAMFLIFKGRYYVKGESKSLNARRVKRCVLLGVFLITIVNVFIASFTTLESKSKKNNLN